MFRRRRLRTLIIALLLATLPCVGLTSFVRAAQPACAMQMRMHDHAHAKPASMAMGAHCKAMSHGAMANCKSGNHCAMCDDLSVSLALAAVPLPAHTLSSSLSPTPIDFLLATTVASLWRPPRSH